jgi:hypothetical protein
MSTLGRLALNRNDQDIYILGSMCYIINHMKLATIIELSCCPALCPGLAVSIFDRRIAMVKRTKIAFG